MEDTRLANTNNTEPRSHSENYSQWKTEQSLAGNVYSPIIRHFEKEIDEKCSLLARGVDASEFEVIDGSKWSVRLDDDENNATIDIGKAEIVFRRMSSDNSLLYSRSHFSDAAHKLRSGGALIVEVELRGGGSDNAAEALRRCRYALDGTNLHILAALPISVDAVSSDMPTQSPSLSRMRLALILCFRADFEGGKSVALERAINEVSIGHQFLVSNTSSDRFGPLEQRSTLRDPSELLQMHYTLQAQATTAEALIASLSETALSAKDASRRLLKIERRVLALRKQTSLFLPVTFPWSLFAGFVVSLLRKRREKRKKKGINDRFIHDILSSPSRVDKDVVIERRRALGIDGFSLHPKILVLKLDHIGDFFLSLPAVELLKKAWPTAEITLVCSPTNGDLARSSGYFDNVIEFRFSAELSQEVQRAQFETYSQIKTLVPDHYDLAIDLRHDPDTRPLLMFVQAEVKAGFQGGDRHIVPLTISLPEMESPRGAYKNSHNVHRLMLLSSHVINTLKGFDSAEIVSGLVANSSFENPIKSARYVVVAPGGGTLAKKWAPSKFASLASKLVQEQGYKIVIVGGNAENEYRDAILSAIPEDRCLDLVANLPLRDLAAVISNAELFVGTDTGATHLAAFIGVPTVVVFSGVADHNIWEPLGKSVCVVRKPIACAPCHIARIEQCVAEHKCMGDISVDDVYDALLRLKDG